VRARLVIPPIVSFFSLYVAEVLYLLFCGFLFFFNLWIVEWEYWKWARLLTIMVTTTAASLANDQNTYIPIPAAHETQPLPPPTHYHAHTISLLLVHTQTEHLPLHL